MKLFNSKEDSMYLTRKQWKKMFLAFSIVTLVLYCIAAIASLCGSQYFILSFESSQMDKIQYFLLQHKIFPLAVWLFTTSEFCIIIAFILKRIPRWYYVLSFYAIAMIVSATIPTMPTQFYQIYPFAFYFIIPIIQQLIDNHKSKYKVKFSFKKYLFCLLRLAIAMLVVFILQILIYTIKTGHLTLSSIAMSLSGYFIYFVEYDIALSVILFTVLLSYKEKGDSNLWVTCQAVGSSSQIPTKQSQKSLWKKNLTKTQRNKIRNLYIKFYLTQLAAFLLLMVLPFVLGKVLEFLVMYASFALARLLLGFKYSLHYKKESMCITVGVIVFGILSLAVPFFYVVLIIAITFGFGLAILLHLSYKYQGMWLFTQVAKTDKFALLYVFFDGDLTEHHVKKMCKFKSLDQEQTQFIWEYAQGNKISYIAWKHNYSQRMTIYKLDEAIEKLTK